MTVVFAICSLVALALVLVPARILLARDAADMPLYIKTLSWFLLFIFLTVAAGMAYIWFTLT